MRILRGGEMNREAFEKFYADAHDLPLETFSQYRMGDTYRLPGIASHWRTWKMALESVVEPPKLRIKEVSKHKCQHDIGDFWDQWGSRCRKCSMPEKLVIDEYAKEIYETWSDKPDYVPWIDCGNSLKQGEARKLAREAMSQKK
jgi:hypothetical protein